MKCQPRNFPWCQGHPHGQLTAFPLEIYCTIHTVNISMRISPKVQKKSSQIICQNVRAKIGKKLGSINSENQPKSCPPVRSICLQGVPLIKHRPPEFLKSERLVSFDQTYSTITPAKLHQNSPNFVCSYTWMSSIQRCQNEPNWWRISRKNIHGARATFTVS